MRKLQLGYFSLHSKIINDINPTFNLPEVRRAGNDGVSVRKMHKLEYNYDFS